MGVTALWSTFRSMGLVDEYTGQSQTSKILNKVDGKAIAIDVTIWMVEAMTQPNLREVFHSDLARVLKVCFDRCVQWLRYGCIPVAVLEGKSPPEKAAEIQRRLTERNGPQQWVGTAGSNWQRSQAFQDLCSRVGSLFRALGLPVFQAPGEAEATCAALQKQGLVHACATRDSDAFVMGATRVFHTIHLVVATPKMNALQSCELANVRHWLNLEKGGSRALLLLALMVGGDYDTGTEKVGPTKALQFIGRALMGKGDDSELMESVLEMLADPQTLATEASDQATQCTGCKRCKHEGGRKGKIQKHTAKNPCIHADCRSCTHDEGFLCTPSDGPCLCKFHTSTSARQFLKVLANLKAGGFEHAAQSALAAYEKQMRDADRAVSQWKAAHSSDSLTWMSRPDIAQVRSALTVGGGGLEWGMATVANKLKLLHREWDLTHPEEALEYKPKRISKVAGKAEAGSADQRWAYLVDFLRNNRDEKDEDLEDAEQTAGPPSQSQGVNTPRKAAGSYAHKRFVRKSVMHTFWPAVVRAFEEKEAKAAETIAKQSARKKLREEQAAAKSERESKHKQTTLDTFLRKSKPGVAKPKAGLKAAIVSKPLQRSVTLIQAKDDIAVDLCSPDEDKVAPRHSSGDGRPGAIPQAHGLHRKQTAHSDVDISSTDSGAQLRSPGDQRDTANPAAIVDLDDGLNQSSDPGLPAADFVDISSRSGASGDVARLDQGEHQSPVPPVNLIPRCALGAFHKCDKEHLDTAEDGRGSFAVQQGSVEFQETGDKADLASISDHGAHGVSSDLDPAYWEDAGNFFSPGQSGAGIPGSPPDSPAAVDSTFQPHQFGPVADASALQPALHGVHCLERATPSKDGFPARERVDMCRSPDDRCATDDVLISPSKRQKTPSSSRLSQAACNTDWKLPKTGGTPSSFEILLSTDDPPRRTASLADAGTKDDVKKRLAFGHEGRDSDLTLDFLPLAPSVRSQRGKLASAPTLRHRQSDCQMDPNSIDLSPTP